MPRSDIKLELSYEQRARNVLAELKQRYLVRIVAGGKGNAPTISRGGRMCGDQVWVIEWKGGPYLWGNSYKTEVEGIEVASYDETCAMVHIKLEDDTYWAYFDSDEYMDSITGALDDPIKPALSYTAESWDSQKNPYNAADHKLADWEIELLNCGLDSPETEDVKPKPKPPTKR